MDGDQRTWIVRLLADDGTEVDGRLEVRPATLTFRPGLRGALLPAIVVPRDDIARADVVQGGLGQRIVLTLRSGQRLTLDVGVLPVNELASMIGVP